MELRDPVSSLSHLFTAVWALLATGIMLRLAGGGWRRQVPIAIYGSSMVVLYLASGVFHALNLPKDELRFYQKLDQTAIYLLIAGTNTPIAAFVLRGRFRAWMLGILWGFAAVGVGCQWLLPKAPYAAIVGICMGMGWAGLMPLPTYYRALGWRAMNWVWAGAGFYTLGSVCELVGWPTLVPKWIQPHEFFHFCISAGSIAFCGFILRYVISHSHPGDVLVA
jgi:hemolysin III